MRSAQEKLIRLGYDLGEWGADGEDGDRTQEATRDFQRKHGLKDDGIYGPETNGVVDQVLATPAAPVFPLPEGSYFGPKSGGSESVSGYFSHREDFKVWQRRMIERGWDLGPTEPTASTATTPGTSPRRSSVRRGSPSTAGSAARRGMRRGRLPSPEPVHEAGAASRGRAAPLSVVARPRLPLIVGNVVLAAAVAWISGW